MTHTDRQRRELINEVARLTRISERQSAMLAQALKEKNDAQVGFNQRGEARVAQLTQQVERLQGYNEKLVEELRDIKQGARNFFRMVGVI